MSPRPLSQNVANPATQGSGDRASGARRRRRLRGGGQGGAGQGRREGSAQARHAAPRVGGGRRAAAGHDCR
eukprot:1647790-Prymnesium_polylepis.1